MPTMRAMTVAEAGASLRMIEQEVPEPGPGEVRLRVAACGVCHSDSVTVDGLMPNITYPRVPGHEVIGTLEAVGPEVHGWEVGARVGVGWFGGACGYCGRCRRGEAFACETVTAVTGVTRDGGLRDAHVGGRVRGRPRSGRTRRGRISAVVVRGRDHL